MHRILVKGCVRRGRERTLMLSARSARRRSMSYTRPGVPTTTCTPACGRRWHLVAPSACGWWPGMHRQKRPCCPRAWAAQSSSGLGAAGTPRALPSLHAASSASSSASCTPPSALPPRPRRPGSAACLCQAVWGSSTGHCPGVVPAIGASPGQEPPQCEPHLQDAGVLAHRGATHACVALHVQVVAQGAHDLRGMRSARGARAGTRCSA